MTEQDRQGPFYAAFKGDNNGVIKQELITYRIREGMLIKEIVSRYYTKGDYQDSTLSMPLAEVKE